MTIQTGSSDTLIIKVPLPVLMKVFLPSIRNGRVVMVTGRVHSKFHVCILWQTGFDLTKKPSQTACQFFQP